MIKHILWDWNGTLLDDAPISLSVMNAVLAKRGMPTLPDIECYRKAFCFPVRDYYRAVGFESDDSFYEVSHEWMDTYMLISQGCPLRTGALDALNEGKRLGLTQRVLSASQRDNLLEQMACYPLDGYFAGVLGLTHIYATSKAGIGLDWLREERVPPESVVLIGDTLHDKQVADAMGCACVLLRGGHQTAETLASAGCPVADDPLCAIKLATRA